MFNLLSNLFRCALRMFSNLAKTALALLLLGVPVLFILLVYIVLFTVVLRLSASLPKNSWAMWLVQKLRTPVGLPRIVK